MTQDGLTLFYTVNEIKEHILRCKVDKIHQPQPGMLVIALRAPGRNPRLLISTGAFNSRLHLTSYKYENPSSPPAFCMFLRKHLSGATVTGIEQTGLERIVTLNFSAKDELGLSKNLCLIFELMGKYSNAILVSEGVVMDSLRRVPHSVSRVRCVLPGIAYKPPKSSKLNPLHISRATLIEMLEKRGDAKLKAYLSSFLQGVSGQAADEILYRYMPSGFAHKPKEAEKLADVIIDFFSSAPLPTMYLRENMPFLYSHCQYKSIQSDAMAYSSFNEMTDAFYSRLAAIKLLSGKRDKLHKLVTKQLEKLISTLQKQQISAERAKKAQIYKTRGDIITANIYQIKRGQQTLVAQDFKTGEDVAIPLNARLSPAANAQQQYRLYNKLRAGIGIIQKRMAETQNDIAFLESVQVSVDTCETAQELSEIEFELIKTGFFPRTQAATHRTQHAPSQPHRFKSSEGYLIYAGKNNRQNDLLTLKTAASDDIWLHTKDIPGAHVIIAGAKGAVPSATLSEAAAIAATLSKAKYGAKVQVDYTQRKNVRKPGGAHPGMVIYEKHTSLLASPDKALLETLRKKEEQ